MVKEQKKNMLNEVKEGTMTMSHQVKDKGKKKEMIKKKKKSQMEILKVKSIITKINNSL